MIERFIKIKRNDYFSQHGIFCPILRLLFVIYVKGVRKIEMPVQAAIVSREEKLKRLVDLYGTSLLRTCYAVLKDISLAEDATQETFMKAYKNIDRFVPQENWSEKAWLMRIAMNTCRDYRRGAWFRHVDRRFNAEKVLETQQPEPDQDSLVDDILSLPAQHREILFLHYYQDLDVKEISKILDVREDAIYKRLERARQKLRVQLERRDLDD
jgi:RNA polymerase sigma-70 factor (ECF subfamily)